MFSDLQRFASVRIKKALVLCAVSSTVLAIMICGTAARSAPAPSSSTLVTLSVSPSNTSVKVNSTEQFKATGRFSDGSSKDMTTSVIWSSSSSATATIQSAGHGKPGLATAVATGSARITAALHGVSGNATLTVTTNVRLTSIVVTPPSATINVGGTQQLAATGNYSDGSTRDLTASATWTSSSNAIAKVQSAGQSSPGLVTGLTAGSATITAAFGTVSDSSTVKVSRGGGGTLTSIAVDPSNPTLTIGATQQMSATGNYSDGSTRDLTNSATWTSSASGVATVESVGQALPGLAKGISLGSATVTATSGSVSGRTTLSVANLTLLSVFVSPASATIAPGNSEQFKASANYSDGSSQDVTTSATWTSSNTRVATVQSAGQADPGDTSAVTNGTASIKAVFKGQTGTATLTVSNVSSSVPIPLMDMTSASQTYLGFAGGLYENNSDSVPSDHDTAGQAIAATIQPLNASGSPSANGKIVFTSIGMSNAADEFGEFVIDAAANTAINHTTLVIANGAKGGITACYWTAAEGSPACSANEENQFDRVRDTVLTPLGVTEQQVQAVWIKEANGGPGVEGCGSNGASPCNSLCNPSTPGCSNTTTTTEAYRYEMQLGEILRAAKQRWPNLKVAFLTSRIYAGYATIDLNPEPYAYEYGYSVKWLIEAQINQVRTGAVDPTAGSLSYSDNTAPWVVWGPYIWANGPNPRSDGLIWCNGQTAAPCSGEVDYRKDGTHPDGEGQSKVAEGKAGQDPTQNLTYVFLNSPYSKAWFAAAK
jgi:hypothetical protein